jgi:nucleotide-binding universal stress UspA family protein
MVGAPHVILLPTQGDAAVIKDIAVNIGVRGDNTPAGDYAVSVASALDAHITGIAIAYDPTLLASGTGYLPVQLMDQWHDNKAAAKAAMDHFAAAATRANISAETRLLRTSLTDAGNQFGRIARRFDLAIVRQVDPEGSAVDATIPVGTLFESGRPVIIVPYIQRALLKLDRVMVCWDGSRPAARAVADAMPLLKRAGDVEITIISTERGKHEEVEGVDMGRHLARHGLKVEVNRIIRGDTDVADALLSHCADSGADFMVMGGYGHSRLREFVLGGVTRSILNSMAVPTLMSH